MNHPKLNNCLYSVGPGERGRSQCLVCLVEIDAATQTLTHESCGNTMCRLCLEKWATSFTDGIQPTCPFCRGLLRDPNQVRIHIYPVESHDELERMFGHEIFLTGRLSNRQVSLNTLDPSAAHESLSVTSEEYWQDSYQLGDGTGIAAYPCSAANLCAMALAHNWSSDQTAAQAEQNRARQSALTTVHISASARVSQMFSDWTTAGVRYVEEYIFPEFDEDTRFYVPLLPYVTVVSSINALRRIVRDSRITADVAQEAHWLPNTYPSDTIVSWLRDDDEESKLLLAIIHREHSIRWALWNDNNCDHHTLYAVPFVCPGVGFLTDDGCIERLNQEEIASMRDPLLSRALWEDWPAMG